MTIPSDTREETNKLLAMYSQYMQLSQELEAVTHELAKAKLKGKPTINLTKQYTHKQGRLQALSDAMTFSTPLVWALYKFEAYSKEAHPIRTIQDFRVHCSKPGYVCTKRFTYINDFLEQRGEPPLTNRTVYPDAQSLSTAFATMYQLSQNGDFMRVWRQQEYYTVHGKVAKWENPLSD